MAGQIGKQAMNLKQFMLRQKVLKLYKETMRCINEVPDKDDQKQLKEWARTDFKAHKDLKDEYEIKYMIGHGERNLMELRKNLMLTT